MKRKRPRIFTGQATAPSKMFLLYFTFDFCYDLPDQPILVNICRAILMCGGDGGDVSAQH